MRLPLPEAQRPRADGIAAALLGSFQAIGGYLYATIDLAAVENAEEWLELLKRSGGRNLFASHPEAEAESLAAWQMGLGDASGHDKTLLGYSVEQALLSDGVTWLIGALPADEMATRLSRRLTARLPEGDALFRCYDPRLLPVIHEAWDQIPPHPFFALGSRWHFLDASFQLQYAPLTEPGPVDPFVPPMLVSDEQHRRLQAVSELHQLARFLGLRKPEQFFRIAPGDRLAFIALQRSNAAACGAARFADVLRYCELAMEHGAEFHRQPRWQEVWEQMLHTGLSLADAVSKAEMEGRRP
ncbi:DUF4123 domain-containing protein [Stenotrophomonas sp. MMGLT7]|uniref:DUF4123 domain-containing protein n=1 Tax=Stenotrophomonas sp. MMGLT7 TaxID=2901227 RepID=UPI001E433FE9|nr:DUF4123 domain-containing protein [Stenotrophomonas sp. MMGLT7]MCD7100419.1 DUF4123 domain-containing protein [Stenotrophomonas sp. MMGLT7]